MELLRQNWAWIAANPWGFGSFIVLAFGAGWGVAKLFYRERIALLEARTGNANHQDTSKQPAKEFQYVASGRHGPNVLAPTTHDAVVGQELSFRADIPENKTLHVVLHGSSHAYLEETSAAWQYNVVGVTNWVISKYQENTSSPIQHFNAESGRAELQLSFGRAGNVHVEVFEGGGPVASWTKDIRVYADN